MIQRCLEWSKYIGVHIAEGCREDTHRIPCRRSLWLVLRRGMVASCKHVHIFLRRRSACKRRAKRRKSSYFSRGLLSYKQFVYKALLGCFHACWLAPQFFVFIGQNQFEAPARHNGGKQGGPESPEASAQHIFLEKFCGVGSKCLHETNARSLLRHRVH